MKTGIYRILNTQNGHMYIGSAATSFGRRWGTHRRLLLKGVHYCKYLQNAWNKYGADAFVFEILEHTDRDVVIQRESDWIEQYKASGCTLYNSAPPAWFRLGGKYTVEERATSSRRVQEWAKTESGAAAMAAARRVRWSKSGAAQHMAEKMRRQWANPDQRRKRMAPQRAATSTPEWSAAQSGRTRMSWGNPEQRAKRIEGLQRNAQRPEYRAALAESSRRAQQDPKRRQQSADGPTKAWTGFVAPDGTIYAPVKNLNAFCREHGLTYPSMHGLVSGQYRQHKGWTLYQPKEE